MWLRVLRDAPGRGRPGGRPPTPAGWLWLALRLQESVVLLLAWKRLRTWRPTPGPPWHPTPRSLQAACDSAHPRLQLLFAEWPLHRHSAHGVCTWTKPAFLRRVLLWAAKDEKSKGEGCVVDADAGEFRRDAVQGGLVIPVDLVPTAKGHIFCFETFKKSGSKAEGRISQLRGRELRRVAPPCSVAPRLQLCPAGRQACVSDPWGPDTRRSSPCGLCGH